MKPEEAKIKIKEQLDSMKGHSFLYGASTHLIKSYRFNDDRERVWIITDKNEFDRDYESALAFIDNLVPVKSNAGRQLMNNERQPPPDVIILPKAEINSSVLGQCKDVLMDSIFKLQKDPGYIAQAQAIKENVDSIIDLGKTEIAQLDLIYRMNKQKDI